MTRDSIGSREVLDRTRSYISENFLYMKRDTVLGNDDALLGQGVIDSMGVIEVLEFIKDEFGVVVADHEITEDNLGTLSAISEFVTARLGTRNVA